MAHLFLDTSAILNGALNKVCNAYVSSLVLTELEQIKNSNNKSEQVKMNARQAIKQIIASGHIFFITYPRKKVEKRLKKHNYLIDNVDSRLLCEAELLAREKKQQVQFITSDGNLYLFAQRIPKLKAVYFEPELKNEIDYFGWIDYTPSEKQLVSLYSDPTQNVLGANANQFCKIFENDMLKDVLFWDGEKYRNIKYQNFTSVIGERIKPRNLEQKMYLDLLQNTNIPIKLCIAKFGTGKSFLALNYALDALHQGRFEKIVFVKNNLEVKGAGTLGTLPGDQISKQYPWLLQIADHIGMDRFEEYLEQGIIEPAHLSTLRGRDLKNCCIIVDEAENLLITNIQLLIGRVASNSEIIFCADLKQCDYEDERKSGIPKMIKKFKGQPLFGMVKLLRTERSEVAAMADLLD